MNTYLFFIDSKSAENESLLSFLREWSEKLSIKPVINVVEDLTTIATILKENPLENATYICVGKQTVFSALLAYAKLLPDNAVVGYIPLTRNPLAQKLGLRGQKDAVKAISQRKLFDITLYSLNQYFMLFDYQLNIEQTPSPEDVHFFIDKKLQVKVPAGSIKFINKQFDSMHPSKFLVVESYDATVQPSETTPILQNLPISTSKNSVDVLQFRLPFSSAQIESQAKITSPLGTTLRQPVQVGIKQKKLRLIVKRGFEISENQTDELLSTEES